MGVVKIGLGVEGKIVEFEAGGDIRQQVKLSHIHGSVRGDPKKRT